MLVGGLATIIVGTLGIFASDRLLRLVSNLVLVSTGILVSALAFGPPALEGALYYLVHSTIAAAFMLLLAHTIAAQRGSVADRFIAGPPIATPLVLQILFLGGVMAIAGLPPWSGFIGKVEMLHATVSRPGWSAFWLCVLGSGLVALFCLARAGSRVFWRTAGAPRGAGAVGDKDGAVTRDARHADTIRGDAVIPDRTTIHAGELLALGWFALAAIAWAAGAGPALRYTAAAAAQLAAPAAYVDAIMQHAPVRSPQGGAR
jgi:multicomponent K+:H+ antiporter subunit D